MIITEMLVSIEAPHFTAGIVLWDDKVVEAAPIIRYMRKWSRGKVRDYCKARDWKISVIYETKRQRTADGLDDKIHRSG